MAWRYQIVILVTDKAESEECSLSWKQGASPLQSARWLWTRAASGSRGDASSHRTRGMEAGCCVFCLPWQESGKQWQEPRGLY